MNIWDYFMVITFSVGTISMIWIGIKERKNMIKNGEL